jgi:hypothetical protein
MNIGELRKLIEGVDDNILVLVPRTMEFDGAFYSPCSHDSGKTKMGTDPNVTEEDVKEMQLLGKPVPEEDAFLLIPCGFGDDKDHTHEMN